MSQALSAAAIDRLPWLADEPAPRAKRGGAHRSAVGWAVGGMLLVAAGSYWMGARSWEQQKPEPSAENTMTLPPPQQLPDETQQPEIIFAPATQPTPAPDRDIRAARPRIERRSVEHSAPAPAAASPQSEPSKAPPAAVLHASRTPNALPAVQKPLVPWPATVSQGAYGRIVRIGAFGTREQAKLGWRHMVDAYPGVAHLQATVVAVRNSRGRSFYRFQIGTTSQAHSEVLCQWMEKIRLSCAVVGLPWKPNGVER